MAPDVDTLIKTYGERLDKRAPSVEALIEKAVSAPAPPMRPRWVLAVGAAAVVLVVIGGTGLVASLLGGGQDDLAPAGGLIPETWTTYTEADGLVGNCASGLAVATDGTLWAVAPEGIFRFEVLSWVAETPPSGFAAGCGSRVAAAPDGSMWFSGEASVVRYLEADWTLIEAFDIEEYGGFLDIAVSGDGEVWAVEGDFLTRLEGESFVWVGEQFQTIPRLWSEEEDPIGGPSISVAPDGSLWVAGGPGNLIHRLYHYRGAETTVIDIPGEGPGTLLGVAPDGSLWFSAEFWGPTNRIDDDLGRLLRYEGEAWTSFELGGVIDAAFSNDGTGWFLVDEVKGEEALWRNQHSDPGVYRFDGQQWTHLTHTDGLAGHDLTSVVTTSDGSIWFGTASHGITRYQPGSNPQAGSTVVIPASHLLESEWPDNATITVPS